MLKKLYITLIVILFSQLTGFAQDAKSSSALKAARKEYQSLKYTPAIKLLLNELKTNPNNVDAQEMLANSYRNIKDYDNSVHWYAELTKNTVIKPEWALYYAEALANKQQYEASDKWYSKYEQLMGEDSRGKAFTKAYPNIGSFLKNRKEWKIEYLNINTAASEYSPMYYKDGLIFSSNRKLQGITKNVFEWDQAPFSDLYYVNLANIKGVNIDSTMNALRKTKASGRKLYKQNDDDTEPTSNDTKILGAYNLKLLKDTLGDYLASQIKIHPVPGKINAKYHEGSAALLPDGSLIFTRNNYNKGKYAESKDGINKLKLYTAKAPDWNDIESFPFNNDQYSIGHPAVNKAGTLLIFTSDMPGGFGGKDLYYSKRASINDAWGKPVNMGSVINTEGDEMFPTLHQDSILYFSSTGHPGLGGLDIFSVALNDIKPLSAPVNLGAPINSSVDDFGLIRSEEGTKGYFTSNRKNSDDIYSFIYTPIHIKLEGMLIDSLSGNLIRNGTITIANAPLNTESGKFVKQLDKETAYRITAIKEGYSGMAILNINTEGVTTDTTIKVVLKLSKSIPVIGSQLLCDSLKEMVAVRKIYYDLDKSFIRPDANQELTNLIIVLNNHPELNVILASHTDCRASNQYNIALSLRRSKSARAYLLAHGISTERIKLEYFGETRLVNNCKDGIPCSEADQQLNRRTEFILTKGGKELQNTDCEFLRKVLNSDRIIKGTIDSYK